MASKQTNMNHSPVLFCDEKAHGLHFVVKDCQDREALVMMIKHGGGNVLEEPGDHGITLAPPDHVVKDRSEIYSTDYIQDCCTRNKILDLNLYRLNVESKYPNNFDVMDVLLKYTTWDDALKGLPFERWKYPFNFSSTGSFADHSVSSVTSECSDTDSNHSIPVFTSERTSSLFVNLPSSSGSSLHDDLSDTLETSQSLMVSPRKSATTKIASLVEESEVNEVVNNKSNECGNKPSVQHDRNTNYNDKVVSRIPPSSQSEISEPVVVQRKQRNWNGNKIIDSTDSDGEDQANIKRYKSNVDREERNRVETSSNDSAPKARTNPFKQILVQKYKSVSLPEKNSENKEDERCTSSRNSTRGLSQHEGRDTLKQKEKSSDSDSDFSMEEARKNGKPRRREYTEKERLEIVKHIRKKKAYQYVKGRDFWQKMEARGVCPGRTWQSLKEHYCKQIIPRIEAYGLSDEEIKWFRKPFQ